MIAAAIDLCRRTSVRRLPPGFITALAAAAATLLLYLPAATYEFVNWDDDIYVTANPHLARLDAAFFRWAFVESRAILWHPLTWISHACDVAVWGMNPVGHHLTSIALHAINTFLVCILALRLLEAQGGAERAGGQSRVVVSLVAGLLFGLHPLHVESVVWVAERKDLLSGLFSIATVLAYLRYIANRPTRDRNAGRRLGDSRYLLCLGCFACALMSKPSVVTLPLTLLVIDWYPLGRFAAAGEAQRALFEKIPFFALSAAALVIGLGPVDLGEVAQTAVASPFGKVLLACHDIVFYIVKLAWPADLSPLYMHPENVSIASARFYVPLAAAIAISAGCLLIAGRRKVFVAVWAAFLATLLPVLGILRLGPHAAADRYAYLSSIGPFLLCGLGGSWCWDKASAGGRWTSAGLRFAAAAACAGTIGLLAVLTARQSAIWKDGETLWRAVLKRNSEAQERFGRTASGAEGNYIAHTNLGMALGAKGRTDEAAEQFLTAIALWPSDVRAHFNLAEILVSRGHVAEAIDHYRRALAADPSFYRARNNLGVTLMEAGDLAAAEEQFRESLEAKPDDAVTHFNLAAILARTARVREAAAEYREVLRLQPDDAETRAILAALEAARPEPSTDTPARRGGRI